MATILRSSKYIRCLNTFTRRIVVANDNGNHAPKLLKLPTQCINSYLTKSYATIPAVQQKDSGTNLARHIAKLDENVQRYGRVFKTEVDEVLSRIRESGYMPSLDGLLLLRCCGDLLVDTTPAARNQMVHEIWNTMETLKIPIDVSHFNALLRVYLENDYEFSPIEILTRMKDKGIAPNRVTYQRLILYNCKKGDIDGATKILEFMRETGLPLNESVFNALITGHSEANDMVSANNILNVMKEAGVAPCSSTYTALLMAHAKRGDMESIKKVIKECETKELYLHDKELLTVIHVLAANGHTSEIDEILSIMPKGPTYNYDASHAILKVLDVGNVKAALKILPTMKRRKASEEESDENESGTFLIRKMVNAKFPADQIVEACEQLEQQGHHGRALFVALERSLMNADTELTIPLLKACAERHVPIREHYMWPLLVSHGKASNYQGIENVLGTMTSDLKVLPGIETIVDYILPFTVGKWDDIVNKLRQYHIPHKRIVTSLAVRMLLDKKIRKTATFMLNYPNQYEPSAFYRPLADALRDTEDARSFVIILRLLHAYKNDRSADRETETASEEESSINDRDNVINTVVQKTVAGLQFRKHSVVNEMMDYLIEYGMNLTPAAGTQLREYFNDELSTEISEKIDKLTSGTLVLTPVQDLRINGQSQEDDVSGGSQQGSLNIVMNFGPKRQRLNACLLNRDIAGLQAVTEELEKLDFKFSPAVCAQIIHAFCGADDLEKAEKWVKKCISENSDVEFDLQKSTAYAALLVKNNRFDDALQFILNSPRRPSTEPTRMGLKRLVKVLLDTVAETGNVENNKKMFDAVIAMNYVNVDNYILGSLIKVHLVRNDLEGALNAFQSACETYRSTPYKNELSKRFIDAEDANSLQRLTDLSTQIHGESNSLVDLVLSFIECGRLRQARKILETPGLRLRSAKLRSAAERYFEDNKIEYLDHFVEMTKDLPIVDRQELYEILLNSYYKKNDWQRGLSLWTEMQEEDVQPSKQFMDRLAQLLENNGQQVPFINSDNAPLPPVRPEPNYVTDFKNAMEQGNLDVAERIVYNAPGHHPDFSTITSTLIDELLIQRKDIDKAIELADMLIVKYSRLPLASTLKLIWNTLLEAGKYEQLRDFGKILSSTTKKKFRFQKYLNRASFKEAGAHNFLSDFESKITDSKKDNFLLMKNNLHFTTILDELRNDPSLLTKLESIAEKLSKQDIHLPTNIIWCYYFEANKPEAGAIWSKYLSKSSWIIFAYLLDVAQKDNNIDLLKRLHITLKDSTVLSSNAKSTVLGSLVELYVKNERQQEALSVLANEDTAVIQKMNEVSPHVIQNLKAILKAAGKSLPSHMDVAR